MDHMGYNRVTIGRKKSYGIKGIKLNSRRFSVQRLQVKFLNFFKILKKSMKLSCGNLLKIDFSGRKQSDKKNLVKKKVDYGMYGNRNDYKLKSYTRSNSFYAEAIADCLDFIKRNSLSIEENHET